jgi:cation transport regulator ChaC
MFPFFADQTRCGFAVALKAQRRRTIDRYTRRLVEIERPDGQAAVRALVYSATADNPNFWWGNDGQGLDLDACAFILATAVGPSGPNLDYLVNLRSFLEEQVIPISCLVWEMIPRVVSDL